MSKYYDDFEKRFTNAWFSTSWSEIEMKKQEFEPQHKDLPSLEGELEELRSEMDSIIQKQFRLANLAKVIQNNGL